MTLQSSGAISLSDIQTEFGGSNPTSLSEYYGAATGVPASGAISFSDFYGTSASVTVTFDLATYPCSDTDVGLASASFAAQNDGDVTYTLFGVTQTQEWTPDAKASGNGDDFEIRLVVNSGTTPTGSAVNTWLAMTSSRSWIISRSTSGTTSSNCTVEIRPAGGGSVLDSATVTWSVTVES